MLSLLVLSSILGAAPGEAPRPATLTFFNREVVTLRTDLLGTPPVQRVEAAQARLERIVAETEGAEVRVVPMELGRALELNGRLVCFVQPGDVDPESGEDLEQAALAAAERLRTALRECSEQRQSASVSRSVAELGVGTSVLVLLLVVTGWLRRKALALGERFLKGRQEAYLRVGSIRLLNWSTVSIAASWLVRLVVGAFQLTLFVQWVAYALARFPYSRPWGEQLQNFLVSLAVKGALGVASAVPDLTVVVAIAWLTWAAMRVTAALFHQVESGHWHTSWLTMETAVITRKLVSLALVLFGLVMAYPYFPGSDTEAFKGLSVLLGLMVSLGGSSTVGQAAAGLILIYTRAFSVGDQVRIGDAVAGRVVAVGMFTTRLLSSRGEELVVPNATILGATTTNFTRAREAVTLELVTTIGYDTPWRQVEALLLEAAARTPDLQKEPAARVMVSSLDDFYVTYRLVAVCGAAHTREKVLTELNRNVLDAFNAAKVQIMSPHYMADPDAPKLADAA